MFPRYPFYRGHAHLETKRREPWMFGDEVTAMVRDQVSTRYQLIPMWYTLFAQWAFAGLPIMRPLWFHNLGDELAFKHVDDEYLLGEDILVRAVNRPGMKKAEVCLAPLAHVCLSHPRWALSLPLASSVCVCV